MLEFHNIILVTCNLSQGACSRKYLITVTST